MDLLARGTGESAAAVVLRQAQHAVCFALLIKTSSGTLSSSKGPPLEAGLSWIPACRQAGLASAAGTHRWVVVGCEHLVPVGVKAKARLARVLAGRRLFAAAFPIISWLPTAPTRLHTDGPSPLLLENRRLLMHTEAMLTWYSPLDKMPNGPSPHLAPRGNGDAGTGNYSHGPH
jgi:hypothetical protein